MKVNENMTLNIGSAMEEIGNTMEACLEEIGNAMEACLEEIGNAMENADEKALGQKYLSFHRLVTLLTSRSFDQSIMVFPMPQTFV